MVILKVRKVKFGPLWSIALKSEQFVCDLGQIMTRFDFLWSRRVILSNVRTDSNLTLFHFWSTFMWIVANNDQIWLPRGLNCDFEKCSNRLPTSPDFTFGQLVRWIGTNNGQICHCRCYKSDFEKCLNRFQLDLILILVNFSYELRQIMTRYDFLEVRWVILGNVPTDSNFTWFYFWSTFDMNWVK